MTCKNALKLSTISLFCATSFSVSAELSLQDKARLDSFFGASKSAPAAYDPGVNSLSLFSIRPTGMDSCTGDFSLSMSDAFTSGTFQNIYESLDAIITSMIANPGQTAIFLSNLYLQKSNPSLHKMINDGIGFSVDDWFNGIADCETMLSTAVDFALDSPDGKAKADALENFYENHGQYISDFNLTKYLRGEPQSNNARDASGNYITISNDANKGIKYMSADGGVAFVGGNTGAAGSPSYLEVTGPTLRAGYCMLRGVPPQHCYPTLDLTTAPVLPNGATATAANADTPMLNEPSFKLFFGDDETNYADNVYEQSVRILGEEYVCVTDNCDAGTKPGMGLRGFFAQERKDIVQKLTVIANKNLELINMAELNEVSAPNVLMVTLPHIRGLQLIRYPEERANFIEGIATDVAYTRTFLMSNYLKSFTEASLLASEVNKAGMKKIIEGKLQTLNSQEEALSRELEINGYTTRQYMDMTLRVIETGGLTDALISSTLIHQ